MSETVQQLTGQQAAELRRQFQKRDADSVGAILRGESAPPLPACPACGAEPEQVVQRIEDPEFGVVELALLAKWMPCGHRFRAVADLGEEPAP